MVSQEAGHMVTMIKVANLVCNLNFPDGLAWLSGENMRFWTKKTFEEDVRNNGIKEPLKVKRLGNEMFQVLNGRHRYLAAVDIGLEEVPCIVGS
jgi:hypothetical protein